MIKIENIITRLQNKFIENAIESLSMEMPYARVSYSVYDIHYFLFALSRGEINSKSKNIVLIFNNELEVFILQSICDVSFIALDVRGLDVFEFFRGDKVFKK